MDKAPDAYRTISEVAEELNLPQHVLRFWETRFSQIKPLKRGGGRRYYRPDDIDLLRGIRILLYAEGYTIRGVQRIIKENGVKAIQLLGRGEGPVPPQKPGGPDVVGPGESEDDATSAAGRNVPGFGAGAPSSPPPLRTGLMSLLPGVFRDRAEGAERSPRTEPRIVAPPATPAAHAAPVPPVRPQQAATVVDREDQGAGLQSDLATPAHRVPPVLVAPPEPPRPLSPTPLSTPAPLVAKREEPIRLVAAPALPPVLMPPSGGLSQVGSEDPPATARIAYPAPPVARPAGTPPVRTRSLSRDDIQRLQATLYELGECKRQLGDALRRADQG